VQVVGIFRLAPDQDACKVSANNSLALLIGCGRTDARFVGSKQMVKDQINSGDYEGNCNDPNILANLIKVPPPPPPPPPLSCDDFLTHFLTQVFFRELPVNVLNVVSDESIHKIARLTPQATISEMNTVFGQTNEVVYWLLDLMVC
jgi:hypothetical protein